MSTLTFTNDMAHLADAMSHCHDWVVRRSAVMEALNLRTGERVLDVGCGGGFCAYEVAQCVGPTGRVCAIDISPDQITAARTRCAEFAWVECQHADAVAPPYGDGEFDAVVGVQVLEYVANLDGALQALHRVLRPGGRLVILATPWSALVWHSAQPERMQRVLTAFMAHAHYPDLPASLVARLQQVGMQPLRQTPVPVLNMSYHANSFSYWLAQIIRLFVVGRQAVTEAEAGAWLNEFEALERQGAYFFCSMPNLPSESKAGHEESTEESTMDSHSGSIAAGGFQLRSQIEGAGIPTIVIGSARKEPRLFSQHLWEHLRLVFLDHRGFAVAPSPIDQASFALETLVDDIEYARHALGLERVAVMGHSGHADMALEYGKKYAAHVSHVVMIGSAPDLSTASQQAAEGYWQESVCPERKAVLQANLQRLPDDALARLPAANRARQARLRNAPKI